MLTNAYVLHGSADDISTSAASQFVDAKFPGSTVIESYNNRIKFNIPAQERLVDIFTYV